MRIPVYRSQAAPSNEAPGRSFRVRMNARPFIDAELQKGSILSDLAGQATEFAKQRYEMISEAEYNEAALEIEEGMRQASLDLSNRSDYRNIFDGKNLWQQQMNTIKINALSDVTNPIVKRKLENEFAQSELTFRYNLQSVVDKKIIAGAQAAIGTRTAAVVADLSKPSATMETYNSAFAKLTNATQNGIAAGRLNGDKVDLSLLAAKKQIAENVTARYVGANPMLAVELMAALETQDRIAAGETVDDLAMTEEGAYTLFTLMNSDRDDAMDVLKDALTTASAFETALEKQLKAEEDAQKFVTTQAKNAYVKYSSYDPQEMVDKEEVLRFVPGAAQFLTLIPDGGLVSSDRAADAIQKYLYSVNAVDQTMQNVIDRYANLSASPFAEETSEFTFEKLFGLYVKEELSMSDVTDNKEYLDREDFIYFSNKVLEAQEAESGSGADTQEDRARKAALAQAKKIAKFTYKYEEENSDDSELGRVSRTAYYNVLKELETEEFNRRLDGNPMTPDEIRTKLEELIAENAELYQSGLRADMEVYFDEKNREHTGLNLGFTDPFADLDAWWESLGELQEANGVNYRRIKRRLNEFKRQGVF